MVTVGPETEDGLLPVELEGRSLCRAAGTGRVRWWNGFEHYDRVYLSKVFTFTPDFDTAIHADEIITGGTGYKDYGSLPPEIEVCPPDYTLYPNWKPAIGFLTRGCIRCCPYCVVPRKEGTIHPAAAWDEIKRPDSREMILLDNNVLASSHGLEQIDCMGREQVWVDFNQGLDARLITPEVAGMLARLHWCRTWTAATAYSNLGGAVRSGAGQQRDPAAGPQRRTYRPVRSGGYEDPGGRRMSHVIKAVLSSASHPENGQITVPFPIPDEAYDHTMELLETAGIGDTLALDCQVDDLDSFSNLEAIGREHCMNLHDGAMPLDEYDTLDGRKEALHLIQSGRGDGSPLSAHVGSTAPAPADTEKLNAGIQG